MSRVATNTARNILSLREQERQTIGEKLGGSALGFRLLDYLFERPIVTVRMAQHVLECSYATANSLVQQFEQAGILKEITGWQRNRRYRFEPYLALFRDPEEK